MASVFYGGQELSSGLRWMAAGIFIAVCLVGAGYGISEYLRKPAAETAAPEVKQGDGSTVLKRAPDAKAKPKHQIPKGAKVERIEEITVLPETPPEIARCTSARGPPVKVDMSIVREADGGRRVIASSQDGQIIAGVDIPVESAAAPPDPKVWAAGLSIDPIHQTPGIWLERDLSIFRVGVELNQTRRAIGAPLGVEARMRLGVSF